MYSEFIFVTGLIKFYFIVYTHFLLVDYEFSEGRISALSISLLPAPNFISIHEVLTDGKPNELIVEIFSFE